MVFSKKWLKNHPKFLLHFQMHIDVLMLCRKFELIPTKIFQVMAVLKNEPKSKNTLYYSLWFFLKNSSEITPNFYYIDVLMLCRKFGLEFLSYEHFVNDKFSKKHE